MIGSMLRKAQLSGGVTASITFVGENDPGIPDYSYTLSWTGGSLPARTAWQWQESTDGTTWSASISESASATSTTAYISFRNQIRYFRVREVSATENGPWSNVVQAWTEPTAPNTFSATAVSGTQINLSWKDLSTNETGFVIERRTPAGSGSYSVLATVGPIASSGGTGTYSDTSPSSGQSYQYRVAAITPMVNSAYSSAASATPTSTYNVEYLVVAGGGGGGAYGGGGAGGYRTASGYSLTVGSTYNVTVGGGGAGAAYGNTASPSVFDTITSDGGGGGGGFAANQPGKKDGSGGGGGVIASTSTAGGTPTSGQGYAGGTGTLNANYGAGGGGGSGGVGGDGTDGTTNALGGAGGAGTASSITGSSVTRAGGGGGGAWTSPVSGSSTGGDGGSGGGGNGAGHANSSGRPTAGSTNTGSGGGGKGIGASAGANGGSGVVILRIPAANYSGTYTNATETTDGSFKVLTFNSSGSYTA